MSHELPKCPTDVPVDGSLIEKAIIEKQIVLASGSLVLVGMAGVVVGGPSSIADNTFCASSDCFGLSRSTFVIISLNASAPTDPN